GGSSATPCEDSVRRRSTGSPPAPTSSSSADQRFPIAWSNVSPSETFPGMGVLGVDVGGTFTDAVLLDGGELRTAKVPTAHRQEESVLSAARAVGVGHVERFAHGTTVATNALLERRGARTAFVSNAGFEHLLHLR